MLLAECAEQVYIVVGERGTGFFCESRPRTVNFNFTVFFRAKRGPAEVNPPLICHFKEKRYVNCSM